MKHVSEKKKKELEYIKDLINKHKLVGIVNLMNLPSAQLQKIKKKLEDKLKIRSTKKRLIGLAIDQTKDRDLSKLKPYLDSEIPALLVSNEDPFRLYKSIKQNKTYAAAKPNQLAPKDLVIEAGPTNFPPGPVIGELGSIGLKTAVESGKIVIKQSKTIVKENEVIKPEIAAVLAKLGIEPIEISLNLVGCYADNLIYDKKVLDIDEEVYLENIKLAYAQALALAEHIQFISKDNINQLIKKAYLQAKALSLKQNIKLDETYPETKVIKEEKKEEIKEKKEEPKEIKEEVKEKKEEEKLKIEPKIEEKKEEKPKEEVKKEDVVGYKEETVKKAQEILTGLQDEKIKKEEKEERLKQKRKLLGID